MISYEEFRKLARQYYHSGGKHFIKTWDKKKYLWYNSRQEVVTEEIALALIKESKDKSW